MRPYTALALAIAAEVTGTTALKLSDGFSKLLPGVAVVVGYGTAFYLLSVALSDLPVGQVYAVWSGVGVVGTAAVGVLYFGESVDAAAVAGFALVLAGVTLLTLYSGAYTPAH